MDFEVADINGNAWPDIMVGSLRAPDSLCFILDPGRDLRPRVVRLDAGSHVKGFALGDLDGDGDLDAAAVDSFRGLRVFYNDGAGSFDGGLVSDRGLLNILAGDFDGDGIDDLLGGAYTTSGDARYEWHLFRGQEDGLSDIEFIRLGWFAEPIPPSQDGGLGTVDVADLNDDGLDDVVVGGVIWYATGGPDIGFELDDELVVWPGAGLESVVARVGPEGDAVVVAAGGDDVFWYRPGESKLDGSVSYESLGVARLAAVERADVDSDGSDEVLLTRPGSAGALIMDLDGDEVTFTPLVEHMMMDRVAAADLDLDGDSDLIASMRDEGFVRLVEGLGDHRYHTVSPLTTDGSPLDEAPMPLSAGEDTPHSFAVLRQGDSSVRHDLLSVIRTDGRGRFLSEGAAVPIRLGSDTLLDGPASFRGASFIADQGCIGDADIAGLRTMLVVSDRGCAAPSVDCLQTDQAAPAGYSDDSSLAEDFNGDGAYDLVMLSGAFDNASQSWEYVLIAFEGDDGGGFIPAALRIDTDLSQIEPGSAIGLSHATDADGDGDVDFFGYAELPNSSPTRPVSTVLFRNEGGWTFTLVDVAAISIVPAAYIDFNNDGLSDPVIQIGRGDDGRRTYQILLADETLTFSNGPEYLGEVDHLFSSDLDRDGLTDLVYGADRVSGKREEAIFVRFGREGGTFTEPVAFEVGERDWRWGARPQDFDGDGLPDVASSLGLSLTGRSWADPPCEADLPRGNPARVDGILSVQDLTQYVERWVMSDCRADLTTSGANPGKPEFVLPDGRVTVEDLTSYVEAWLLGCP